MKARAGTERATPYEHRPPAALVVDDDPAWQAILAEILADAGLAVEVAGSVAEAIAALRARPHRLAIVDLSLDAGAGPPGQQGLRVLEAVREHDPGCVPILLTGFATVELAVSALTRYGAFTVLQKDTFRRGPFGEVLRQALGAAPSSKPTGEGRYAGDRPLPGQASASPGGAADIYPVPEGARVLLVEDDAGWRSILGQLLAEAGFQVRACRSFGEALGYLLRERFALAVVDLSLAGSAAPEANRDGELVLARARAAGIPAIVVSGAAQPADVERAYAEHGLFAYLEKQAFDRRAFLSLAHEALAPGQGVPDELRGLTARERETLALLARGLTNKDIAAALVVSPNTVKRYLKSVFAKLGVDTRAAAAAKAIRAGLRPPEG